MSSEIFFGGLEAGGTKCVAIVGTSPESVRTQVRIPTTTPEETLARIVAFFRRSAEDHGACAAFGVASFGPLDLDPRSPAWGFVTETPKPGWSHTDLVGPLRAAFGVPVGFDTDVNGAGLAEALWGAGRECPTLVYLTVGTGIGGGVIRSGVPLGGLVHPEMGHLRCPRHPEDRFPGLCRVHGDCLEGLASGPAVLARFGAPLEALPPGHPAWELLGFYLGHLCATVTFIVSPHRIVLGGGLSTGGMLLEPVRRWTRTLLAGYPEHPVLSTDLGSYITAPAFGDRAGSLGALVLARRALQAR